MINGASIYYKSLKDCVLSPNIFLTLQLTVQKHKQNTNLVYTISVRCGGEETMHSGSLLPL